MHTGSMRFSGRDADAHAGGAHTDDDSARDAYSSAADSDSHAYCYPYPHSYLYAYCNADRDAHADSFAARDSGPRDDGGPGCAKPVG